MALEMPWNILIRISEVIDLQKMIRNVETVNRKIPVVKIFFLPIISASLPNGSRNIAEERIKLLAIHPRPIALAFRSLPIAGSARLMAEPRNGVRNAANVETSRTDLFRVLSSAEARFSGTIYRSLFLVSIIIVTGPSLIISTDIIAPNSPVPHFFPVSFEIPATNFS
jgi:hypothetical protein